MGQDDTPKATAPRFTKMYDKGFDRLDALLKFNPMAARVWSFLVKHAGHDNAIVCTYDVIADDLEVSTRSVMRGVAYLEESQALKIFKIGSANAYVLNENETWKTYEEHKRFCAFSARTLASFKQNPKRRMTHVMKQDERETATEAVIS